jgi:hypothetical protein
MLVFIGIARADIKFELVGQIEGPVGIHSHAAGKHVAAGVAEQQVEEIIQHAAACAAIERVDAEHATGATAAVVVRLDLMRGLLIAVERLHVGDLVGQGVEIDIGFGVGLAFGSHVLEGPAVGRPPVDGRGDALQLGVVDIEHAVAHVVAIGERQCSRREAIGRQHLRGAHARLVVDPVERELHVEIVLRICAQIEAQRVDLLVAHLLAGVDVLAETITVETGDRDPRAQAAVVAEQRAADGRLHIQLAVVADGDRSEAIELLR